MVPYRVGPKAVMNLLIKENGREIVDVVLRSHGGSINYLQFRRGRLLVAAVALCCLKQDGKHEDSRLLELLFIATTPQTNLGEVIQALQLYMAKHGFSHALFAPPNDRKDAWGALGYEAKVLQDYGGSGLGYVVAPLDAASVVQLAGGQAVVASKAKTGGQAVIASQPSSWGTLHWLTKGIWYWPVQQLRWLLMGAPQH